MFERVGFPTLSLILEDLIMNNKIVSKVRTILEPILSKRNLSLYDLTYRKEGKDYNLHVILDRDDNNSVSIEDCEVINRELGDELDKLDFIDGQYILQVESPGLDRELRGPRDFDRFSGALVDVHLFAPHQGSKNFIGELKSRTDEILCIISDDQNIEIPCKQVAKVNLHIDF